MIQKSNADIIIDRSRLRANIDHFTSILEAETGIMAVVKANAYGHGAVEVAKSIEGRVDSFAVNDIEEGIELREAGINSPILVFGVPEQPTVEKYRMHNLTATISSEYHFEMLPNGTQYHINFDTGMGRLGFDPGEAGKVKEMMNRFSGIICTGIYSHFATAEEPDSKQVLDQYQSFEEIRTLFPESLTTHIANTGGTAFYDFDHFDMVRLGIGIYGYSPSNRPIEGIRPVMSWKSYLADVKPITEGSTVSYGAEWTAPKNGYLGIIPTGYEDGLRRNLSGQFSVKIAGRDYETVGTITMNYVMVFLGDDYFNVGEEVLLLHDGNDAADWAQKLGTISYEILTGVNARLPRKYIP